MRPSPITGALGAELSGIDLADPNEQSITTLRSALDEFLVVKVSDQSLDRFQLSRLGAMFGPHFLHPIVSNGYEDCPEVLELLRKPEDKVSFGGYSWHADITWMNPGGYASFLHAKEIPEVGGDTSFASTIAAFERLSAGMQSSLRNLTAVHAYNWFERREVKPWVVEHPVVRKHSATGREGLYINRMFTSRFSGMTVEESAPLLEYLFGRMEEHDVTCRFRWRQGDLLIWDNRFTLHYPINDISGKLRRMIRTSVLES